MGSNILLSLGAIGGVYTSWIIPFLFTLTIIVFFHELGHYLVAKMNGIRVLVFSIGFGPELVGFNDRSGTRWKISLIPLGGYVRFFGDENEASVPDAATVAAMTEEERKQSFPGQSVLARASVVAAGPITNFILAIVIFAGVAVVYGKMTAIPRIAVIDAGSPAEQAGFQPNDLIVSIDGEKIDNFADVQRIVNGSAGRSLAIEVERGEHQIVTLHAVPAEKDKHGILGIKRSDAPSDVRTQPVGVGEAIVAGADKTWFVVSTTLSYLGEVATGRQSADQIGGPIKIAQMSGEVAKLGIGPLLEFTGLLSVSIGLLNLFPVPLLDGGHLLFYLIEAVRGRPLSERAQEFGFRVGLALVLMLMFFAAFNDLRPLWTRS